MKNILIVGLFAFFLSACASTNPILTQEKLGKINISQELYECPVVKTFPNPDKLTDIQVAKLIVQLYKNNQKCKTSIEAIEEFIVRYNSTIN